MTNFEIDTRYIEAQFFADMTRYNIAPRQSFNPVMDGKTHRFATARDRGNEKSGAYFIHSDEWPAWGVMDYRQHERMIIGKFNASDLDRNERAKIFKSMNNPAETKRREAEKAEEQKRQKDNRKSAVFKAWTEYHSSDCFNTDSHPYCRLKKISRFECQARIKTTSADDDLCKKGDLMLPFYNVSTGKFQGIQIIRFEKSPETGKHFKQIYTGTSYRNAAFSLIPYACKPYKGSPMDAKLIYICEGVATASSFYERLNSCKHPTGDNYFPVFAAMNCSNIKNVAKILRGKYPNAGIIIAADNDQQNKDGKSPGLDAANATIKEGYADAEIHPPVSGMDWNDFLTSRKDS